VQITIKEGPW